MRPALLVIFGENGNQWSLGLTSLACGTKAAKAGPPERLRGGARQERRVHLGERALLV